MTLSFSANSQVSSGNCGLVVRGSGCGRSRSATVHLTVTEANNPNILGAAFIGTVVFPISAGFSSIMHQLFGGIGGFAMVGAILTFSRVLKLDRRWHAYGPFSLVIGLLNLGTFLVAIVVGVTDLLVPWDGLVQRVWASTLLLWVEVMAIQLLRLSPQPPP